MTAGLSNGISGNTSGPLSSIAQLGQRLIDRIQRASGDAGARSRASRRPRPPRGGNRLRGIERPQPRQQRLVRRLRHALDDLSS
ncbi:MAG: hypothetical protein ACLTSX_12375 [Collinsella sp.]